MRFRIEQQRAEFSTWTKLDGRAAEYLRVNADERRARARLAEDLVERYLSDRGYRIVARNLRLGMLEVDIVARREDLVVVVEVRTRSRRSWTTPHGSILPAKRARLRRAAQRLWQDRYRHDASVTRLRIDAASVVFTAAGPVIDYSPAALPA